MGFLKGKLDAIPKDPQKKESAKRSTDEILEEILSSVRNQRNLAQETDVSAGIDISDPKILELFSHSTPIKNYFEGEPQKSRLLKFVSLTSSISKDSMEPKKDKE